MIGRVLRVESPCGVSDPFVSVKYELSTAIWFCVDSHWSIIFVSQCRTKMQCASICITYVCRRGRQGEGGRRRSRERLSEEGA